MANRFSIGSGLASSPAVWDGGASVPVTGDRVLIAVGTNITLDGHYEWGDDTTSTIVINTVSTNRSITVRGTLTNSRSVDSSLTCRGSCVIDSGGEHDIGTAASPIPQGVTAAVYINKSSVPVVNKYIYEAVPGSKFTYVGAYRKRHTVLTAAAAASATTIFVEDATGWQVGDTLQITCDSVGFAQVVTIAAGYTPSALTVPISAALVTSKRLNIAVGNATSNVLITSQSNATRGSWGANVSNVDVANSREIRNVQFLDLQGTFTYPGGACFRCVDNYGATRYINPYTSLDSIAFTHSTSSNTLLSSNHGSVNPPLATPLNFTNCAFLHVGAANTGGSNNAILGSFTTITDSLAGACSISLESNYAGRVVNTKIVQTNASASPLGAGGGNNATLVGIKVSGVSYAGLQYSTANVQRLTFIDCDFSSALPTGGASQSYILQIAPALVQNTMTNCAFSAMTVITETGQARMTEDSFIKVVNKNSDLTAQEDYRFNYTAVRSNSEVVRGTSSISIKPVTLNSPAVRTQDLFCANGASIRVIGYIKSNALFFNGGGAGWFPPTASITGLGVTTGTVNGVAGVAPSFAGISSATWEKYDITVTNTSGADGFFTLNYTATPRSVTTGTVFFDGVTEYPFVNRCRHYGFVFDEAVPTRVVNLTVEASEATAAGYSGITVTWATGEVVIGSNVTFQYLYDYIQYQACQPANIPYAVPITGAGVAGSPTLFLTTSGLIMNATGYTLNGPGSLVVGDNFLWGSVPFTYQYGSGTFSQAGAVPSFSGGVLQIGATGAYTFNMGSPMSLVMTPAGTGTYNLSSSTFSGQVDLMNDTAFAITVQLPAGTSYTTANNTGGTITVSAPVVTQGLSFTGLSAGSQVKVFTTTTTTELFTTSSSGTSETWSQAGGADTTVDYTIMKAGLLPTRVVGVVVNSAVVVVPVSQIADRSYQASSGLAYGSTATVNTGTSRFTVTVATTGQNWYSFMIESWIAQAALKNRAFPISSNGPNSFTLEGWEFSAGLSFLYRDGLRYTSGGTATAIYAAIYSVDTAAGNQVRYQQVDGSGTTDAATTGKIDQLIQVYGDAGHGNFDKRGHLTLKIQKDGYDQAEADVVALYGSMEDQLYVVGLNPISNGLATGSPFVAGTPTIIDHGASPVTWNSKQFSITITDSATGNTAETLMRWIRYNLSLGGTFQGKDGFNWHDLVQLNGSAYKTVRGAIYGDTGASLKGVRVLNDAGDPHPDFNLFTADDGTTYAPPAVASITITNLVAGSRVQLYDTANSLELFNAVVAGTSTVFSEVYSVDRAIRLRVSCVSGVTAKDFVEVGIGAISAGVPTLAYQVAQVDDTVYNANAIDGSTVTECSIVGTNLFVNVNAGSITISRIYAFMVYWLSTVGGIEDQSTEMVAKDTANYIVNTGFQIRNNTTGPTIPLLITGGNIDPATGIATDILDTSGGSIFVNSAIVVPFSSGAEATVAIVQAGLSAQGLTVPVVARIDAPVSTRATAGDIFAAT